MQPPDSHPFLTLWAAVGPLVGVGFGTWLQTKGQHKQWRRDNVRQECRELLGQLSVNLFAFIDWTESVKATQSPVQDFALAQKYSRDVVDLHRNFGSRLLIANEIKQARIAKRWNDALDSFLEDDDEDKLNREYEKLVDDIVTIGLKA